MKLSFYGADQCVTGSCHCLEVNGKKILVDCGSAAGTGRGRQRRPALRSRAASTVVLVTHAHIDHSGRIPMLIKNGLSGPHHHHAADGGPAGHHAAGLRPHPGAATRSSKNRKNQRGRPRRRWSPSTPWQDAHAGAGVHDQTCEYGQQVQVVRGRDGGVHRRRASAGLRLHPGGRAREGGETSGSWCSPATSATWISPSSGTPSSFTGADYVVMESTYGDRNHTEVLELYRRPGPDHRRDHRPGRQRGDPLPSPWAAPRSCCTSSGRSRTRGW